MRVLMLTHQDTVWPHGTLQRLPFSTAGGVVRGPGSFDMLTGLVMAIHSMALLQAEGACLDGLSLLVTGDEEVGSSTSRDLIIEEVRDSPAVLVLEASASGGAVKVARKGASAYRVLVSIEDSSGDVAEPLFEFELAVDRVRAARRAIDESGTGVVLTGRSEGFVCGRPDIEETIRRLHAYAEAGADCLYAPRIATVEHVAAVLPKPLNLLINAPFTTVAEAEQLGVRRISVGGTLARTAWGGFLTAAQEIADAGTFSHFEHLPNVDALLDR